MCRDYSDLRSPSRNDPTSGLLHRSGGRLFQSLAVLRKNMTVCEHLLWNVGRYILISEMDEYIVWEFNIY